MVGGFGLLELTLTKLFLKKSGGKNKLECCEK